ncbi:hypothetical protein V2A60_007137 [Cordyceps javanica]|uniref:DNA directed RNA polymerase II 15 kDa subunit n=1 Tax=Cordyceps javanica TaxID=43265 RepID=A0A545VRL6_9HYPO|nr:DNA directed RNA polymerase II 15 kDa subunit [Cordyceps javanica]TQW04315.1 DNA directed RNA polymerase II 15 kDa subunit [Cordyceps javanica]
MATPQSTTSYQGESSEGKTLEQITFRFCSECSNMLYPKEDEEAHKLQFTCRTCQYTEEARSTCVFRNILNNSAGETAGVTQDVGADPTVSDHHHHALPVCLHCGIFITCNTCGVASPDVTATTTATTTRYRDADDDGSADFIDALVSNIGWTEEDLFDEFGADADFEFGQEFGEDSLADNSDTTSTGSEFSSEN